MHLFEYKVDLRTAFDDFLTLSICAFGQNLATGKSYDEDLYLQTIARYKGDDIAHEFPKLLACLTMEMEKRMQSDAGFDVLGEFYEQHISRGRLGQYFTPWPICTLMAKCSFEEHKNALERNEPVHILDPSCGSGRMLLASSRIAGPDQYYFGIDLDQTCVKMTALNLFLSGIFHGEVMCANALVPGEFTVSYKTSFLPFGLFRILDKEKSRLWNMYQHTFKKADVAKHPPPEFDDSRLDTGSQLTIF